MILKKYSLKILLLTFFVLVSGCSTKFSTLDSDQGKTIYQISEVQAFKLAQTAILKVLPGREITNIDGRIKGYSTWFRFVLDTYTQQILIYPVSGIAPDGNSVSGFYFEVSGSGSSFVQGRAKNVALWETLLESLQATNSKTIVKQLKPLMYSSENPFNYYQETEKSISDVDIYKKLERLKELNEKGILTDDEFLNKKAELLEKI